MHKKIAQAEEFIGMFLGVLVGLGFVYFGILLVEYVFNVKIIH